MSVIFPVLGIALVTLALVDSLWTTLWVDGGGGPLSSRTSVWTWRGYLKVVGRDRHQTLSLAGPLTLVLIVLMWIVLLWAGWVFIFAGSEQSLQHTRDHTSADWTGRVYFVAYMMFTAGNGDFSPQGDVWQIVASLSNGSGMAVVTLAITYLLSVVSAVVRKRALASQVTGLGRTAEDIVHSGWNGKDFRSLDLILNGLASEISFLSQQYEAYPVLQYYHGAKADKSPIVGIAVLDEALTVLRYGIREEVRPNPAVLQSARASVRSFLEGMPPAFIHAAPEPPPPPKLQRFRDQGIPTVDDAEFGAALEYLRDRRRKLLGLLRNDGWDWSDY